MSLEERSKHIGRKTQKRGRTHSEGQKEVQTHAEKSKGLVGQKNLKDKNYMTFAKHSIL